MLLYSRNEAPFTIFCSGLLLVFMYFLPENKSGSICQWLFWINVSTTWWKSSSQFYRTSRVVLASRRHDEFLFLLYTSVYFTSTAPGQGGFTKLNIIHFSTSVIHVESNPFLIIIQVIPAKQDSGPSKRKGFKPKLKGRGRLLPEQLTGSQKRSW